MQEVELLDGGDPPTAQPATPARTSRRLWWIPAGVVAVALTLVGTQLVLDAREDAAVERLSAVPGVFPPLGDELRTLRTISQADTMSLWAAIERRWLTDGRAHGGAGRVAVLLGDRPAHRRAALVHPAAGS